MKKFRKIKNNFNFFNIKFSIYKKFTSFKFPSNSFLAYLFAKSVSIYVIFSSFCSSLQFIIHNNTVKETYLLQYLLGELESVYNVL